MKICHITPGHLPINRANNWGAVERIIYNYKLELELLGHSVDIKYTNEIQADDYDIVHVHMLNSAYELFEKGIPYILTIHDHHILIDKVDINYVKTAINNSIHTFTPGKNLIEYLKDISSEKLTYLSHGVDTDFFTPIEDSLLSKKDRLLCVGNNGILGSADYDRKGFLMAIEAAKILNIPLTIAGPTINNKTFFEKHNIKEDNLITIKYDVNEKELINLYQSHTIFLHPSNLELGHPNLTILEALSCGLPVVGTVDLKELPGMYILKDLNTFELIKGIREVLNNYIEYRYHARTNILENYRWETITAKLLNNYENYIYSNKKDMGDLLIDVYENTLKRDVNVNPDIKNDIIITFLDGAKVHVVGNKESEYYVEFLDDNYNVIYSDTIKNNHWAAPAPKYYVKWKIRINDKIVYDLNLTRKNVLITLESKSLGDTLAWVPYADEFRKKHNCNVFVTTFQNHLFVEQYPNITFLNPGVSLTGYDAWYRVGCYDNDNSKNKNNWREITLQQVATDILGLEYTEIKPSIYIEDEIKGKYVTISEFSTLQAKFWNNPDGWQQTVNYLNDLGYKVVSISKEESHLKNVIYRNDRNIQETIKYIKNADFHISLGTGTSWLAWSLNKPVILISGFSNPDSEFKNNCFRVFNDKVCNSCYNDIKHPFERGNWDWCPRNKGFECSKEITFEMVKEKIDEVIKIT